MSWTKLDAWHIFLACYSVPLVLLKWSPPAIITQQALEHPLETIALTFLLPIITYAFTPPSSLFRFALIPMISVLTAAFLRTAHEKISNNLYVGAASGPTTLLILSSIDFLVLQNTYIAKDGSEQTIRPTEKGFGSRIPATKDAASVIGVSKALAWAYDCVFSYRGVGSPRCVKNLPPWSYSDTTYTPSRPKFLAKRLPAVIGAYLFLDFLNNQPPPNLALFTVVKGSQFSGFSTLSAEDVITRVMITLIFWISLRLTIALIYNAVSLLFVCVLGNSPADWPPYFGSVTEAYSIRQFWGKYWQLSLRNILTGNAKFITHGVLRQKRGTITARYLNILFPFVISGVLHSILDICSGVPDSETRAIVFFILQAFRIMFEDFIEYSYGSVVTTESVSTLSKGIEKGNEGERPVSRASKLQTWHKIIGYGWVATFMVWSTPAWTYPNVRYSEPGKVLLPYSVFGWAKQAGIY